MRYACGIVLYNPSCENIDHLKEMVREFELVFIWDNSECNEKYVAEIQKMSDEYIYLKKNAGLAKPYNFFLNICEKKDVDILCILDQDTQFDVEKIKRIKKNIAHDISSKDAIYAPRLKNTSQKDWVINSNSFLNVSVLKDNSIIYDEFYYLDRLDADFCRQVRAKNLQIKIYEEIIIDHRIGEGDRGSHAPIRHYYMFRNRRYFNYKFYPYLHAKIRTILQDLKHILSILLYEKEKVCKISQLFKGIRSYKNYLEQTQDNKKENI